MSKYGYSIYGASKYGITPKLAYSVEPMSLTVLRFNQTHLVWQLPTGTFTRFRVVRNQNGYPETSEDGVIIYELISPDGSSIEGSLTKYEFFDGLENPLQAPLNPGRNVFYRVFLYTGDNVWVKAGEISDIVPEDTGAITKVMNLLPRVLTSKTQSPLDIVDTTSTLYDFLDGISFTYEDLLTLIRLGRPSHNLEKSNYKTIPGEVLNVGLTPEPNLPMLRQRALIREAIPLYANKGTTLGITNYAESLTGFAPTVTVSGNLMLTIQDSTFYEDTGRWSATNATISATEEMVPDNADYSIDLTYTMKIEPTDVGSISLGDDAPITQGVPINPEIPYVYTLKIKCPASGGATLTVKYYDKDGGYISEDTNTISAGNAWDDLEIIATSPAGANYVSLTLDWDTVTDYYIDMVYVGLSPFFDYEEARAVTIQLAPKLENYIENPSFEVDDVKWVATDATFSQDTNVPFVGYPGTYSAKYVAAGPWSLQCTSYLYLEPGTYFNVSSYLYSPDMASVRAYIDIYDAYDVLLDSTNELFDLTPTNSGDWNRYFTRTLISVGSNASYAKFRFEGTAGTIYIDMVMAQDTYTPTDYFDGSLPELNGVIWERTAHASKSLYYPSKATKITRLAQTLNEWLPMNTWWRVTTPAGLEYTNLTV